MSILRKSSPHARGCFQLHHRGYCLKGVFPACAGVFLVICPSRYFISCLPRMRGGVSYTESKALCNELSSPHARGCFLVIHDNVLFQKVFPACAGVFLMKPTAEHLAWRLPRMRGGVSTRPIEQALMEASSPHARGCFRDFCLSRCGNGVFPACAGVFLRDC